jgi:hypothetical protein
MTWLSIGNRIPAIAATRELLPATAIATLLARIDPREVCTPVTRPSAMEKPVTSQFWTISTPRSLAPRAYPMPPRRAGRCRRAAEGLLEWETGHYRN